MTKAALVRRLSGALLQASDAVQRQFKDEPAGRQLPFAVVGPDEFFPAVADRLFRKTRRNGNKPRLKPLLFQKSAVYRNKTLCISFLSCGKQKFKTFRWHLIFFIDRVKTYNRQQKHINSELFAAYFWDPISVDVHCHQHCKFINDDSAV